MLEAVKVALDPTPAQERQLLSHAGAARFAFNAALAYVKEMLGRGEAVGWSLYALRRWWNAHKDVLAPWWRQNSKEAYSSGLESLAQALRNWAASRDGKRKGPRMGVPPVPVQGPGDATVRVHDRLVRPDTRRCEDAQAAPHRPGALHGGRHRSGR